MTEYLITFNDEWVPDHTEDELREKGKAARAVIEEMLAEGETEPRSSAGRC